MSPQPLSVQLTALEQLQEVDLKIDQLRKTKEGFPLQLKSIDDQIKKQHALMQTRQTAAVELEKKLKETRASHELNTDRLSRSSARLEGVEDSHQFQAMTKEVEQLKKLATTLEQQQAQLTSDLEATKKDLAPLQAQLDKLQAERTATEQGFEGQLQKLESEIKTLTGERTQFLSQVEPRILAQYDRIRAARGGMGIAVALVGRCHGCNMMLPPQMFIEIQKATSLHQCPTCKRILFVKK